MNAAVTPTTFTLGPTPNTVRAADGTILTAPDGWVLLPPGDSGLTRRVKAACDHWVVQEKRGRKTFSRGLWAPAATIEWIRAELEAEQSTEGYARRQEAASRRREHALAEYVEDFHGAVLAFHSSHAELADRLARAVTEHATPVGSGTVARTQTHPGRAACGSGRYRLDAAPDDRLRQHGDPQGQGSAARGPADAGQALPRVAGPLPAWGTDPSGLPAQEGVGVRIACRMRVSES